MDVKTSSTSAGIFGAAPGLATAPSLPKLKEGEAHGSEAIREVARQFESIFLHQVYKSMRATVPKEGMFGAGFGGQVFTDMLDQQYADLSTKNSTSGLAESIAIHLGAEALDPPTLRQSEGIRRLNAVNAYAKQKTSGPAEWTMPVQGGVSSKFGMRRLHHEHSARMHAGVDIAAKTGSPIAAARAGEVVFAGERGGYGKMVIIDHGDDIKSLYAHASELHVEPGQKVAAGDTIAAVGSTGKSTGPHLHFEVRQAGRAVDPGPLLGLKKK
jgi:murein DD-endopeptidase MepM/ murein hydrolase activator NlpD